MRRVEAIQLLPVIVLGMAAFVVAASNGAAAQVVTSTTTSSVGAGCTAVIVTSSTSTSWVIDCTVNEGTAATIVMPAGFPFPPFLGAYVMSECNPAAQSCPVPVTADQISDVLTISSSTVGSTQTATLSLLSDTDPESSSAACWVPQDGSSCIPMSQLVSAFAFLEDSTGIGTTSFCHTTGSTSVCVNVNAVSDGAGGGEVVEATGVPQFGLPAAVVAAVSLSIIAYLRIRTRSAGSASVPGLRE